jgi:hypothetical protein
MYLTLFCSFCDLWKFGFRLWYLGGKPEVPDDGGQDGLALLVGSDQDVLECKSISL